MLARPETIQTSSLAFRTYVLPLERTLYTRALGLERTPQDACDLVQDTFERALRCFDQFRPGTNVKQWLFRIMFNLFVDRYRRRMHEMPLELADAHELPAPEPEPAPTWHAYEVEDVQQALGGLEPPFRQVLELHFNEHRSYKEISGRLGIPAATVGTRLLRARCKLRNLLDGGRDTKRAWSPLESRGSAAAARG